ncbi:MAG: hypothetical protein R3A79_23975 [Nannocystaceae bacterium]
MLRRARWRARWRAWGRAGARRPGASRCAPRTAYDSGVELSSPAALVDLAGGRTRGAARGDLRRGARLLGAALWCLLVACNHGPWERGCEDGDDCGDDESCELNLVVPGYTVSHSICAPLCEADDDCPPPGSGNAAAQCTDRGVCELRCGDGIACPSGTVCVAGRCKWPAS